MTTVHRFARRIAFNGVLLMLALGGEHTAAFAADGGVCTTIGEQKIAIVLVSFPSKPLLTTITPEMLRKLYFGAGSSVDAFLRESSYGKTWATGQVVGPVVLDADYFNQPTAARDAAIRVASTLLDFRNFTRVVLVVPQSSTGLESGGLGTIGCSTIPLSPTGSFTASTTWLGDVSMGSDVAALAAATHEFGHNLGLEHARAADFGDEALGPLGQLPAAFDQTRDYGDSFSNMARGQGHWAAPQKAFLGWMTAETDYKRVETAGSFVLQPYEIDVSGLKAIRVRRSAAYNDWLWIEYRQAAGFDSSLPAGGLTGALVHYEDADWKDTSVHSNLLRFKTDGSDGVFFGRAPLAVGSSWSDPYSGLTVSVGQATAGLSVTVNYAPPPLCTILTTPAKVTLSTAAAGTATIDVSAASDCSWAASSSASWITLTPIGRVVGRGQVTVSVSANPLTTVRWGRVSIGSTVVAVIQPGVAGSSTISPSSANFPASGGVGTIAVSTNASDYQWDFISNTSWIQSVVFSKQFSTGSGTLRYTVAQNTGTASRTGTITIDGHTFTVTQAAAGTVVSQLAWQDLSVPDAPISRLCMDVAPFSSRGEAVLYGGAFDTKRFTDTWVWNGTYWVQKFPAHSPGERCGHTMAYDAVRQQVVLFGGFHNNDYSNETWIWDGTDWKQLNPQHSPPARSGHAMVYEAASGKILLFGGAGLVTGAFNDTWEWDGSNWTQRNTVNPPPARHDHSMAYDAARNEVVLFGGTVNAPTVGVPLFFSDTWVWNGAQWTKKSPAVSPAERYGHKMGYDPDLGYVVLVGGENAKDVSLSSPYAGYAINPFEETWTWDGTNWLQRFPNKSPEFSYSYGMFYDTNRRTFIVHLGDDLHCATRGPKTYSLKVGATSDLFSIVDRGGVLLASSGVSSSLSTGYAGIQPNAGNAAPAGLAIFGFRQNGVLVNEAAAMASPSIQSGRIYVEIDGPVNTGVAIANPGGHGASVSFYFTDMDGNAGPTGTITIPSYTKIAAFFSDDPFNAGSSFRGTFTFTASIPVFVAAVRSRLNERSEFLSTTLPVTDLSASASTSQIAMTHYDGGGWRTEVVLVNPGDSTLTGSVQFADATTSSFAYSIPARAAQRFQPATSPASLVEGSVVIVPARNTTLPAAMAIFSFRNGDKTVTETAAAAQRTGTAFRLYGEAAGTFGQAGSIQTGFTVTNNSINTVNIVVEVTNLDGSSLGLIGSLVVRGNEHVSVFLNQIRGLSSLKTPFQGVLRISSPTPFSIIGLRARYNERQDLLLTAMPPVNESTNLTDVPLYFPHIVDSGGFTTQFILFSGQPGRSLSGTFQLYSPTGSGLNWTIQ